jgi:hypothetical protein
LYYGKDFCCLCERLFDRDIKDTDLKILARFVEVMAANAKARKAELRRPTPPHLTKIQNTERPRRVDELRDAANRTRAKFAQVASVNE